MKKFKTKLIVLSQIIVLTSCGNTVAKESYKKGEEAILESKYKTAESSFKLALEEGYKDNFNEIKELVHTLNRYNYAQDLYDYSKKDLSKLDDAQQELRKISKVENKKLNDDINLLLLKIENKKSYILEDLNVDENKDNLENKAKDENLNIEKEESPKKNIENKISVESAKEIIYQKTHSKKEYSIVEYISEGDFIKDEDTWYFMEVYSKNDLENPTYWYFVNSNTGEISEEGVFEP